MIDEQVAFEHHAGFEAGEASGNVRLGKFESHYEELFAEVIEDGIITAEERQRLDRAADALGLDKRRLRKLEAALQAAYETRHQVKIRDLSGEDDGPRASLRPIDVPDDPGTQSLLRRIGYLEARVKELETELEEARASIAVEVDFSDVSAEASPAPDDPVDLARRIRHDPRDVDALRALYKYYLRRGETDRAVCLAHTLVFLGEASADEAALERQHRPDGLIRPWRSLTQEGWRRLLYHPDAEVLTGDIFSVIVSAVLLGRVSALRREKAYAPPDATLRQDAQRSTVQAVRSVAWAAAILGMETPPIFADPDHPGLVDNVIAVPPALRIGRKALSGRSPSELAFASGRALCLARAEHFVRAIVPSVADLEDLFLSALHIGNPGIPLAHEVKKRVLPIAQAIEPILEPSQIDRLRGHFLRFVEEGGRTNLLRWSTSADLTAARAGLLLSGDLRAAKAMLEAEDAHGAPARIDDLVAFVASDRYAALRKQLGIAVESSAN